MKRNILNDCMKMEQENMKERNQEMIFNSISDLKRWNPDKENKCPKNKEGHNFSIRDGEYIYCEYCGKNQQFNCPIHKRFIIVKDKKLKG